MPRDDWPELDPPARRRIFRVIGYCFAGVLVLLLVVLAVGAVYQAIGTQRDRRAYPPPGQMVDVGGYALHARVEGEGSPVVVFEAGLGSTSVDWSLVVGEVAKFTTVVGYDRAGMGWSEAGPEPPNAGRSAEDLYRLLDALDIEGPYVLVGHGYGGLIVRLFYRSHPDAVSAMVLVDTSHEQQMERLSHEIAGSLRRQKLMMGAIGIANHVGFMRALRALTGDRYMMVSNDALPPRARDIAKAFYSTPQTFGTIAAELGTLEASMNRVAASDRSLGDTPLMVLAAGKGFDAKFVPKGASVEEVNQAFREMQEDLATLSTNGERVVVEDAGHFIQFDRPDVVIEAIRKLVDSRRIERVFTSPTGQKIVVWSRPPVEVLREK